MELIVIGVHCGILGDQDGTRGSRIGGESTPTNKGHQEAHNRTLRILQSVSNNIVVPLRHELLQLAEDLSSAKVFPGTRRRKG